MSDVLVVGGGVIGLSLAYELAGQGVQVRVIDAGQPGREASWAGAGILPPACATSDDPLQRLTAVSNVLHARWSQELRELTGIDNGYRRCGAIYLARSAADAAVLSAMADVARRCDVEVERLTAQDLEEREPHLRPVGGMEAAYLVPDECQIRNPRHLRALVMACQMRGVEITAGAAAEDFELRGDRFRAAITSQGRIEAGQVVLASGSWTAALARRLGVVANLKPIRGQIVLLCSPRPLLARIVNEGSRYLVPRGDGRVLVGSTEEDAGFDRSTTAGAVSGLLELALGLCPELAGAVVERSWAGLRPCTSDGLPYLGSVPGCENAWLAAGHFRSGLQLSTGTALVMSQLLGGRPTDVDLSAFRADRDTEPAASNSSIEPASRS